MAPLATRLNIILYVFFPFKERPPLIYSLPLQYTIDAPWDLYVVSIGNPFPHCLLATSKK